MSYPYENLKPFTLPKLLDRSIELYGSRELSGKVDEESMTYSEFGVKVQHMVKMLEINNISKGDKVALLGENMPNWGVAYFAITYIGAVVVPILPDFHKSDVHHILRHSEAKGVFVSKKFEQTIKECENSELGFAINLEELKHIKDLKNLKFIDKVKQIAKKTLRDSTVNEDDMASLIYTSGTTGHSKGVMLSHKNLVTNAMSSHSILKILPTDVFLSILPLAHTFECTVGLIVPILHGSSIKYISKAPTPSVLLKAFKSVRPTMMLSVPLIIEKIYKSKILSQINSSFVTRNLYKIPFFRKLINKKAGQKLIETFGGRIRFYGVGGAGISPYVEEFLYEAKFPYIVGYGLTETAPLLCGTPMDKPTKVGSTGPALYGVDLKIKNKNPKTGEGEICAKSPSVMLGYYKDEAQTKEVMEDGWFLTGDLGYIDEDGYLFISGRSKNVIIGPAGENIYPEQIESIINKQEEVLDSLVLDVDGKLIAKIHLDYELLDKRFKDLPQQQIKDKIEQILENIRVEVNTNVSSFSKITKALEQKEPFIKTPTKKIKRYLYVVK